LGRFSRRHLRFDDISGVSNIRVKFRCPSENQTIDAYFNQDSRVSGDNKDGLYNNVITFTQENEIGTWLGNMFTRATEQVMKNLFTTPNL
jgi:hypothetical protein